MLIKTLFSRRNLIVFLITIGLVGGGLYGFKDQFIVATVNGQLISRLELVKELEKQYGKGTLEAIVTETLILQEAEKQGVSVSDEEISQEIQKLEEDIAAQGQDLNQILSLQGMTQEGLKEQIMFQKTAEKLVQKGVGEEELDPQELNERLGLWVQYLRDNATLNYLKEF